MRPASDTTQVAKLRACQYRRSRIHNNGANFPFRFPIGRLYGVSRWRDLTIHLSAPVPGVVGVEEAGVSNEYLTGAAGMQGVGNAIRVNQ